MGHPWGFSTGEASDRKRDLMSDEKIPTELSMMNSYSGAAAKTPPLEYGQEISTAWWVNFAQTTNASMEDIRSPPPKARRRTDTGSWDSSDPAIGTQRTSPDRDTAQRDLGWN